MPKESVDPFQRRLETTEGEDVGQFDKEVDKGAETAVARNSSPRATRASSRGRKETRNKYGVAKGSEGRGRRGRGSGMRWSPTGVPDWNWNWTAVRPERYIFLNILVTVPQSPRHAALPPTGYYPLRTYYFASCTWLGIAAAPLPSPSTCSTPLPRVFFLLSSLRSFAFLRAYLFISFVPFLLAAHLRFFPWCVSTGFVHARWRAPVEKLSNSS